MKKERKEVFLKNFNARVNPDRLGMLRSACEVHNVELRAIDGLPENYYFVLTEKSILEDLFQNTSFAIDFDNEDGALLMRAELANLEVLP